MPVQAPGIGQGLARGFGGAYSALARILGRIVDPREGMRRHGMLPPKEVLPSGEPGPIMGVGLGKVGGLLDSSLREYDPNPPTGPAVTMAPPNVRPKVGKKPVIVSRDEAKKLVEAGIVSDPKMAVETKPPQVTPPTSQETAPKPPKPPDTELDAPDVDADEDQRGLLDVMKELWGSDDDFDDRAAAALAKRGMVKPEAPGEMKLSPWEIFAIAAPILGSVLSGGGVGPGAIGASSMLRGFMGGQFAKVGQHREDVEKYQGALGDLSERMESRQMARASSMAPYLMQTAEGRARLQMDRAKFKFDVANERWRRNFDVFKHQNPDAAARLNAQVEMLRLQIQEDYNAARLIRDDRRITESERHNREQEVIGRINAAANTMNAIANQSRASAVSGMVTEVVGGRKYNLEQLEARMSAVGRQLQELEPSKDYSPTSYANAQRELMELTAARTRLRKRMGLDQGQAPAQRPAGNVMTRSQAIQEAQSRGLTDPEEIEVFIDSIEEDLGVTIVGD